MTASKPQLSSVNEFVIKFANVNGSGSASANQLFAKVSLPYGCAGRPAQYFSIEHSRLAYLV